MSDPLRIRLEEEVALFDRVLANEPHDGDLALLQNLLRERPQTRGRYLAYAEMHADLYGAVRLSRVRRLVSTELLGDARVSADASPAESAAAQLLKESSSPRRFGVTKLVVWSLPLAIAASLLVAVFGVPDALRDAEESRWVGGVAAISRIEGASLAIDDEPAVAGDVIVEGAVVRVDQGFAEVEFRQGAVAVLEGPAEMVVYGSNHAALLKGNLAAIAPPWAVGFTVDTPKIKVIDHGTQFAISVDEDSPSEVSVMVTDGEVEVLKSQQEKDGQRLFAGEGVRTAGEELEPYNDDSTALRLTAKLPQEIVEHPAQIVADRWHDWRPGVADEPRRTGGWRHFTNATGPFGDPSSYHELLWNPRLRAYTPYGDATTDKKSPLGYVKVHRDGGHPGKGRTQTVDGIDRYSISAYIVPEDGVYRIEAGWLERPEPRRWDLDHVLDIAAHVNDGPILFREYCDRQCFARFGGRLGELRAGDTIYVGVGASGVDHNDRFRWSYYVVKEEGSERTDAAEIDSQEETNATR